MTLPETYIMLFELLMLTLVGLIFGITFTYSWLQANPLRWLRKLSQYARRGGYKLEETPEKDVEIEATIRELEATTEYLKRLLEARRVAREKKPT